MKWQSGLTPDDVGLGPGLSRRSFVIAAGTLATSMLVACGSGSESGSDVSFSSTGSKPVATESTDSDEEQPVEIAESGYSVDESGYVMYGIVWKNPNKNYQVNFPTLTITGRDADNKVVFSDEQVMNWMRPGEEQRFGCQAGNGVAPATVEFTYNDTSADYTPSDEAAEEYYTIANPNEVADEYGSVTYTGEITTNVELEDVSQAWVSVILRDANGDIIYGSNSFADLGSKGESRPFEIDCYNVPEHASFELDALPWM